LQEKLKAKLQNKTLSLQTQNPERSKMQIIQSKTFSVKKPERSKQNPER